MATNGVITRAEQTQLDRRAASDAARKAAFPSPTELAAQEQGLETPQQTMEQIKSEAPFATREQALEEQVGVGAQRPDELQAKIGEDRDVKALSEAQQSLLEENIQRRMGSGVVTAEPVRAAIDAVQPTVDRVETDMTERQAALLAPPEQVAKTKDGTTVDLQDFGQVGKLQVPNSAGNLAANPGLTAQQQQLFDDNKKLLQDQEDAAIREIQQFVQSQVAEAKQSSRKAFGTSKAVLARMGALNVTSAGVQYMSDLQGDHVKKISEITSQGLDAINEARAAKASGDSELLAKKLETLQQNKENAIAEDRAFMEKMKFASEMQQYQRESAASTVDAMVGAGFSSDEIPEEYLKGLDAAAGFVPGTSAGLMDMSQAQAASEAQMAEFDLGVKQVDLQQKLADLEGTSITQATDLRKFLETARNTESYTINGVQYHGLDNGLEFEGYEIDKKTGDVITMTRDKGTGQLLFNRREGILSPQTDYDIQEVDGAFWYVPKDPSAGPAVPVPTGVGIESLNAGAINKSALEEDFPQGKGFSKTSWCLEWIRDISTGAGSGLPAAGQMDTIGEKRAWAQNSEVGLGKGQRPPQPGDVILTNEDSKWGHIALVTGIETDPQTGEKVAILSESNYKKGRVTHGRTIPLTSNRIMGFQSVAIKDKYSIEPRAGQDFTGEGATYGQLRSTKQAGGFETPQEETKFTMDMRKQFNAEVGEFTKVRDAHARVLAAGADPSAAGDIALIFNFMKVLDPGSVVRESEFATAASAGGLPDRMIASAKRVQDGKRLSQTQRNDFLNRSQVLFDSQQLLVQPVIDQFTTEATNLGLDPSRVIGGSGSGSAAGTTTAAAPEGFQADKLRQALTETKTASGNTLSQNMVDILVEEAQNLAGGGATPKEVTDALNKVLGY